MDQHRDPRVDRYLAELQSELRELPAATAIDIHDGIAEELRSLSPEAAAARMTQLGDPRFVATAARAETTRAAVVPQDANPAAQHTGRNRSFATRGMVIATAIAVGIGGFVVPLVGWIAGITMLWFSPVWRRWEKLLVTLVPVVAAATLVLITQLAWSQTAAGDANPLAPSGYDATWTALILCALVTPATGVFLLVRGLRRV